MKRTWPMRAPMVAILSVMIFGRCSGGPPSNIGLKDGKLSPCPQSPNCVSTRSADRRHSIEALPFLGSKTETMTAILILPPIWLY